MKHSDKSDNNVIIADHIIKKLHKRVIIDDVTFSIKKGEIFCLLGPNGAGKSVLTKILCGLVKPDRGGVTIINQKAFESKDLIGYCPQEPALYDVFTVYENLQYFGRSYNIPGKLVDNKITYFLDQLGLNEEKNRLFGILSGGQKKRVSIICSLLHDPDVLILDEPTSGLDPASKRKLWDFILKIKKTILFSTHDMEEAELFSDRIAIINKGRILKLGNLQELKSIVADTRVVKITSYPGDSEKITTLLKGLKFMEDAISFHGKTVATISDPDEEKVDHITKVMQDIGERVHDYHINTPNLDDVFMTLVGERWHK